MSQNFERLNRLLDNLDRLNAEMIRVATKAVDAAERRKTPPKDGSDYQI